MKKIKLWRKKPTKKELMKKHRNDYMLLSRLKQDCDYFLGHGNRYEGRLWAGSVKDQIKQEQNVYKNIILAVQKEHEDRMKGIINIMTDEDVQLLDREYMYNNSSNLTTKKFTGFSAFFCLIDFRRFSLALALLV